MRDRPSRFVIATSKRSAGLEALCSSLILLTLLLGPVQAQQRETIDLWTTGGLTYQFPQERFRSIQTEMSVDHRPVQMTLLEPLGARYQGELNSGFLVLAEFRFEIEPQAAMRLFLDRLSHTFDGGLEISTQGLTIGGELREGYLLDINLMGVRLEGRMAAYRQNDITLVVYTQALSREHELLAEDLQSILDSIGLGQLNLGSAIQPSE